MDRRGLPTNQLLRIAGLTEVALIDLTAGRRRDPITEIIEGLRHAIGADLAGTGSQCVQTGVGGLPCSLDTRLDDALYRVADTVEEVVEPDPTYEPSPGCVMAAACCAAPVSHPACAPVP